jgi:hypothetical protein
MGRMKKDLKGMKFGRLTVISESGEKRRNRQICWNCRCDCGTSTVVMAGNLLSGTAKSCGCLKKEIFCVLSREDVIKIKSMFKKNVKNIDIARKFGVSPAAISMIKTGKNWRHV